MRTLHWIILGIVFVLATWFIYRTRQDRPRVESSIDLNWRFVQGDPEGASDPGYDDTQWRYVSLPHDWMIEQPVHPDNPSGTQGGFYPGGVGWYRKSIDMSSYRNNEQFYLLFEGVFMNADVYFNGVHLGTQSYGYVSFFYDISSLVRADTINVIAVRSDCSHMPVDRWYSGAGICRHVKLIATSPLHFPVWGHSLTSVIDSSGAAGLTVSLELVNNGRKAERFEVIYDIVGPDGRVVADGRGSEYLEAGSNRATTKTFRIEDPYLWSPDRPDLYQVNCYLADRNRQIDHISVSHGIRTAHFDPEQGFVLNGKKMMMKGVCIHHDGGELGAAVPMESWRRRLSILKELGVNALRLAHNPHAPEVLDLCDRMGFLVINEMYDQWELRRPGDEEGTALATTWEKDLSRFIRRDRNHPSVVLWSVGNETLEQLNDPPRGVEWYRDMIDLVHSIDPTREVTCALHPGNPLKGHELPSRMMRVSRVVSYNYRSDSFRTWHSQFPDLVFIASETKPYGTGRKADHQVIDFGDNSWKDMEPFVAGQFVWAGIDYLGESMGWPDRGWRHGLLQTSGFVKPAAWYIGSRYRDDPIVRLAVKDSLLADSLNRLESWQASWALPPLVDHWTFPGKPAKKEVVVFTNCAEVELYLNDRLIATLLRETFHDGVIKAVIDYEPGELVARAAYRDREGRNVMVADTLTTAAEAYALAMDPERGRLESDGRKVVHITTSAVDSTGIPDPRSNHLVSYSLQGPGRIRAIDNGDLADHTPPGSSSRQLRQGRHLLILQAGSEPGDLIISATAEGLHPSSVKIKAKE